MEKKRRNAYNFVDLQTNATYHTSKDFCNAVGIKKPSGLAHYLDYSKTEPYKIIIKGKKYEVITLKRN